jgi:hypothetical protein
MNVELIACGVRPLDKKLPKIDKEKNYETHIAI